MALHNHDESTGWSSRWLQAAVIALTVLVFGLALGWNAVRLRVRLREQILARDAEVINAIALLRNAPDGRDDSVHGEAADPLDDLPGIVEASQRRATLAVRLFDAQGRFLTAVPPNVTETNLNTADLELARRGEPISRFLGRLPIRAHLLPPPGSAHSVWPDHLPMAEVLIPLLNRAPASGQAPASEQPVAGFLGVAEVLLDGRQLQVEIGTLDRNLLQHTGTVFVVGSLVVCLALGWAFRRLNRTQTRLLEQTVRLQRANQELTLAAKTSALGPVTAHLIHGLKNPLSGLQNFVAASLQSRDLKTGDLEDAAAAAARMQNLIEDVVRLLQEDSAGGRYEVSFDEVGEILESRLGTRAAEAGVRLRFEVDLRGHLDNRQANLVLLVLENLLHNAIQASPREREVVMTVRNDPGGTAFVVSDSGRGLPAQVREHLFQPVQSDRLGGSGLGLALSNQLAARIPADLVLRSSGPNGTVFVLTMTHANAGPATTPTPLAGTP